MTLQEFKNIKIGDFVYIRDTGRRGKYLCTQVLEKDSFFFKITVLLGRKPYSYKYIKMNVPNNLKSGVTVGIY